MNKFLIFIGALLFGFPAFSQSENTEEEYVNAKVLKYDDVNYVNNVKTVMFHETSWDYSAPLINLNNGEQLELSFDDIDGDQKQYSISFIHCNADWTPSDLRTSEYINGFYELHLLNFAYSMNTFQKYTHYSIIFPMPNSQQNTQFTKSGNYLMIVYLNGDRNNLVMCRRFMVYDNKISIGYTFRQSMGNGDQYNKQHIDFTINPNAYDITNPFTDLNVVMVQNNRWDNAVSGIKPTFLNGNQLVFSLDDASTFNGGNEFRYFDMRSLRFLTERVKDIYKDNDLKNHVVLQNDEIRAVKPYLFYNDINGSFLIKNREGLTNNDIEADYVYVEFFLPYMKPESEGNFYIMGKLTDWRMNANSKMTYNELRNGYEKKLYLKQGYYNYSFVLSNDAKKGGDETITEGNFWDTENDYNIYVYHRKFGGQYDQLIGMKKINSLKK
ncbi:MAG: DUF5103 domain-containing protein [Bacteroidota bacterium]